MDSITVEIDGTKMKADKGSKILDIAGKCGVEIPTLCYEPRMSPYGACRMCLVEVEGARGLLPACTTEATDGMIIKTRTERLEEIRKTLVELLLSDHRKVCYDCAQSGRCELQTLCDRYGLEESSIKGEMHEYELKTENPFIMRDYNKCILCGRCIRICREVQGVGVYDFIERGFEALPGTPYDDAMQDTPCEFCGQCISACPTAAISAKPSETGSRIWKRDMVRATCAYFGKSLEEIYDYLKMEGWSVRTTCPYCGCGCQIDLNVIDNRIVEVTSPPMEGPNQGNLCMKGRFGYEFVNHPDRLTKPLIRKGGELVEVEWEEAVDLIAAKFSEIKSKNGSDAIGVMTSARITNEENYAVQKFARAVIGTNNIDHCARLCHAPTVAGLAKSFGSGAMTNSIDDIEEANCILVIGSNTTEAHPIIGIKVKKAVVERECKLIVCDTRHIRLCRYADKWLRQKPGTDVALLNGMINVIIEEKLYDEAFVKERTEGFEELAKKVKEYTPEKASQITGVDAEIIREAARIYALAENATILYSMGITQHTSGTDNVLSVGNLAMLCGNIGKRGTGVNPLRGQNNVQGACDAGGLPNVFTGYQQVVDESARKKFEGAWKVPLPDKPGMTVTEMLPAAAKGNMKAMYIIGENPLVSDADLSHAGKSIESLDFLVVQDIFLTETAMVADVVLPAASWAEKEGTFTNTDRRVQRVRKAVKSPGEAKTDLEIVAAIAAKMGYEFSNVEAKDVFDEIASLTPSYAGISYERIDKGENLHWPCKDSEDMGTPILHTKLFTRGKGLFAAIDFKPPAEETDDEYPLILTTGRVLEQYHTGTMTRRVRGINEIDPTGLLWINPSDADDLGVKSGDTVKVQTRRGSIETGIRVTKKMDRGVIFMPWHYSEVAANVLTNSAIDPVAKIPELKVCAARVSKI